MKQLADKITTDFPTAPSAYGLNGPSAPVTVEKSTLASHTEIRTPPWRPFFEEVTYRVYHYDSLRALERELSGKQRLFYANDFVDGYHGNQFRKLRPAFGTTGTETTEIERVKEYADSNCNASMHGYLIE